MKMLILKLSPIPVILKNMKKIVFVFLVILFVLPSLALAQPVIKVSEDMHNFGVVDGRNSLEHTFEIRNEGNKDLIIERVSPP